MRLREFGSWVLPWGGILIAGLLAVSGYVLMAGAVGVNGFPLDDAWIHQTYARNLAELGEWSFLPGQTSAGSTAPLWSAMLALGRFLGLDFWVWTMTLGWLCLAGVGIAGAILFRMMVGGESGNWFIWVGVFLVGEWHLVWAAVSGMETALYCGVVLMLFYRLARDECDADNRSPVAWRKWLTTGVLIGGLVWVRPDGLTMLGPAILVCWVVSFRGRHWQMILTNLLALLVGFGLFMIPYLVFNMAVSGSWMPNTFYAKQAEYAIRLEAPFIERAISLYRLPLIGAGALLLPGVLWLVFEIIRRRWWSVGSSMLWYLGYTLIFVLRLPLDYQHGRYLIPIMPVYFVLGMAGTFLLMRSVKLNHYRKKLIVFGSTAALAGVWLSFYLFAGSTAYIEDVSLIESEMVAAAQWAGANLPQDALLAAHDIGAMGYFSERELLDLAGLVSPEVIPFMRDEARLGVYMTDKGVDYLVTFPGWYPELVLLGEPVYQTNGVIAPKIGGENMVIYRWFLP
jgi:hypothetical protein